MEVVADLEREDGIGDFPVVHHAEVLLGGLFVRPIGIAGDPASDDDPLEVQGFAEFLPGVVETPAEPLFPVVRGDEDINAVEVVPFGVVVLQGAVADDLLVGVPVAEAGIIDDEGQGPGHHPALVLYAELPLGKAGDHRPELVPGPGPSHFRVYPVHDPFDFIIILKSELAQLQFVLVPFPGHESPSFLGGYPVNPIIRSAKKK